MSPLCESCGKFQKDGIPHDHRRLLGSAMIYPDGTATVRTAEELQQAADDVKYWEPLADWERERLEAERYSTTGAGRPMDPARFDEITSRAQVSPFVAGRHDLQPRPFKRRWWNKPR